MSRAKVCISILVVLILTVLSGASVWAAPNRQDITGKVKDIQIDPWVDPDTGETMTTVLVTIEDEEGETQTVRVSVQTAQDQGLLQVDEGGELEYDPETGYPIPITIVDPENPPTVDIAEGDVLEYVQEEVEEAQHPVALALAEFIAWKLGPDDFYETIMGLHEQGFGFGLIAQAWWMSWAVDETADHLDPILQAKKNHDFSGIPLPDDIEETPTNWGQFKKLILGSKKAERNLGEIMSGRAQGEQDETGDEEELGTTSTEGKVKGKKGKGPGEDGPPGQNKDKGGGKPETPPGKGNKGGGKGGGKKK